MTKYENTQKRLNHASQHYDPIFDLPRVSYTAVTEIFFNHKAVGAAHICGFVYGNSTDGKPTLVTALDIDGGGEVVIPGDDSFIATGIYKLAISEAKKPEAARELAVQFEKWKVKHSSAEPDITWTDIENIYDKQGKQ